MPIPNPAQFGRLDPKDWATIPDHYTQVHWPDVLPHPPSQYGDNGFHGRTHPEIVWVALQRYTQPGDVVWDCFAGGGTTLDVCAELGNPCIANDVRPTRPEILQADSVIWRPNKAIDLVICHPPYMDVIDWPGDGTLAIGDLREFKAGMRQVFTNILDVLKSDHVMVLIVGQVYRDGCVYALDMELWPVLLRDRFRLLGRVVRGYGETKGGEISGEKNEHLWKYRRLRYGLWALGIDTVLFLQKLN